MSDYIYSRRYECVGIDEVVVVVDADSFSRQLLRSAYAVVLLRLCKAQASNNLPLPSPHF